MATITFTVEAKITDRSYITSDWMIVQMVK